MFNAVFVTILVKVNSLLPFTNDQSGPFAQSHTLSLATDAGSRVTLVHSFDGEIVCRGNEEGGWLETAIPRTRVGCR